MHSEAAREENEREKRRPFSAMLDWLVGVVKKKTSKIFASCTPNILASLKQSSTDERARDPRKH